MSWLMTINKAIVVVENNRNKDFYRQVFHTTTTIILFDCLFVLLEKKSHLQAEIFNLQLHVFFYVKLGDA